MFKINRFFQNRHRDLSPEKLLNIIFSYMGRIARTRDLDAIIILMADMTRDLVQADRCTLWLIDNQSNELWTKYAHGLQTVRVPMSMGLVGYATTHNEAVIIDDAYSDSRFNPSVDKKTGYKTKSVMIIPINDNEGKVIGAYQVINKLTSDGKFTNRDLEYMTLASSYTGKAIEAALLNLEIEQTQKEIIFVMGEIGESRSKETGNHVKRVAEYSRLLALYYGLDNSTAELIKMASPMHDIGKVGIPDRILQKPEKLNENEFEIMKTHTEIGYNLLKSSHRKIIEAAAIISEQHHERWDGRGYPRGLKGDEIHVYGRITALSDVFDALSSDRCYKKAWEMNKVIDYLEQEKGKQFDPWLVSIFIKNIDEFINIKDCYKDDF